MAIVQAVLQSKSKAESMKVLNMHVSDQLRGDDQ